MGVSHSMNTDQVERVLTEFEATTRSIKGIEEKMSKVKKHAEVLQAQRQSMSRHAESLTDVIDGLGESMVGRSEAVFDYFSSSFEKFAGSVEMLETSLYELHLQDAPRQIQREFGPIMVPAVVLVLIVAVSNCYFGFLLARDEDLTQSLFALRSSEEEQTDLNILNIFAISHVVLLSIAVLYIILDVLRRRIRRWQRRRKAHAERQARAERQVREEKLKLEEHEGTGEEEEEEEDSADYCDDALVEDEVPKTQQNQEGQASTTTASLANAAGTGEHEGGNGTPKSYSSNRPPSPLSLWQPHSDKETKAETGSRTPVTQMLRYFQQIAAASHREPHSPVSPEKWRHRLHISNKEAHTLNDDWTGEFFVKAPRLEVRMAAVASAQVLKRLQHGHFIHVRQAIRGAHGRIWGRIEEPPGWVVLSDPLQGEEERVARQLTRRRRPSEAPSQEAPSHGSK